MDEHAAWKEVGARIRAARESVRPRLSARAAARQAGMSEGWWRQLERGERRLAPGVTAPMNPKDADLDAACRVVGLDPTSIFELVGRTPIDHEIPERLRSLDTLVELTREYLAKLELAASAYRAGDSAPLEEHLTEAAWVFRQLLRTEAKTSGQAPLTSAERARVQAVVDVLFDEEGRWRA